MTFADEFALEGEGFGEQPEYPAIFGISVTPVVGGVVCALLGVAGAAALGWYLVKPTWENLQAKQAELSELQNKIDALQQAQAEISKLTLERQRLASQKNEILGLFASEEKLDTLLFDLGSQIQERQGQLIRFEPKTDVTPPGPPTVVADGSWGQAADGLLKTKQFSASVEGTFDQVQSILRSIEQLQLLSAIGNFDSQVTEDQVLRYDPGKNQLIPVAKPKLTTTFTLETLVPLSGEELEQAAQAQQAAPAEGEEVPPAQ